ncbi:MULTISPECIES: amino acid adenylation domain-containing protein [unclassified Rhodococcus (in: high G+C Gram-positive bacteria)]|uniref:amino acid adenylation domain-containing protein n=1 Tax=unclassified Rhodococcus (in: high G+C Gram-positive bacteria) TaxID=192944 RepID=UPI003392A6B9
MSSVEGAPSGIDLFPLSPAQLNIYFAQKLAPGVPFTIAQFVEIRGDIDPATLIRATDIACRELESPGVRLGEDDGQPYQWVDLNVPYAMIYRDLRDESDPVGYAHRYMDEQYRKPVDLVRDQLIASEIMQVGDAHYFWYSRAHHVVMDGLGAISVQERTAAAYTALLTGADVPKTRAVGVRAIYDYETAYVGSTRYEADREYWVGRLDGHADAPRLAGTSHSGAAVPSAVSISVGAVLDDELTDAMAALAQRYNSSDVPVVLATFALYLARMTGTDDVMLSLPVSGRATTKLRDSSGMMSNIVPLRIGVDPDVTIEELLRRIQVELTGALRHQRFRVEDMQRETDGGFEGSTSAGRGAFGPTVNIMMYDSTIRLGNVIGEYRVLSSGPIDDMMVNVYPGVAGASTRVDFLGNPAIYSTEELSTHHQRFLALLRTVLAAPDGLPLADLKVLSPAEEEALLAVDSQGPRPVLLPELLRDSAVVRYAGQELTGIEFVSRADHIAGQLAPFLTSPETRIAIALDRSMHSVLALWSVSVAGASFVPVDPHDPTDRLTSMLGGIGVRVGITGRALLGTLPSTVEWLAIEDLLGAETLPFDAHQVHLDNEAYVIHTSGSTGKPKAVSLAHRGLAQLATAVVDRYSVSPDARVLHLASPVFDASIQEILAAFAAGATLVIAPADVYAGPALADLLAEERITHLITSPTVLATLEPLDVKGLEVFDVGGEACSPALRDRFADAGPDMLDAYGPTEATVLATLSAPMAVGKRITIGGPLPGVRALVLDSRLRPVPYGGIGELYLGGDSLARGYDGQPGVTASRFVADPAASGRRLYRTGDLVRWSIFGTSLEYLGRADQQLQLHGRRLELGEIESVALQLTGVDAVAVDVREDHLVAYVVGESAFLSAHLRGALPAWMVPDRIVELEALPLSASGKLDRRALPDPAPTTVTEYVAPQSDTERAVAAVFAEVLDVPIVGRTHSFFELGGDSLSATRVVARLGSAVTLPVLFDAPTVAAIADAIDSAVDQRDSLDLLDTVMPEQVPLSYSQQRMWFLNQFDSASPAYNMPVAVQLPSGGDSGLVIAALRDVLERHESLRTYFPDDGNGPRQVVLPTAGVLPEILTSEVGPDQLDDAITELASKGFDVAAEVPIRASLLAVSSHEGSPEATVVVIVMHHISVDGWSIDPLVRDFTVAYAARSAGHAPTWPRLQAQYSEYAVWNRAVVDAAAEDQLRYWTIALDALDRPSAELPTDRPRPAVQSMQTAGVPVAIGTEVHARIRALALGENATTFMVVHAALALTLSRFSDCDRTVLGSPSAGRGHAALDDMVGMFVGTVPLAVEVDRDGTFTELLESVRHADLDGFAHSELPFERIVDALTTDRSLDRHPLFQVMLAFDNARHQSIEDLPVTVLPISTHTSEFDLNVVVTETADGIAGDIEYAIDLYDRATVERFAAAFVSVLGAVVENPSVVVGDIELASLPPQPERDATGTLLDVLAIETADRIAVDGESTLTYRELDARSNRLARLLIDRGAAPESTVALSLVRSAEYIVALWAVVKSGAAFLPVDPSYPALRREQILTGTHLGFGGVEEGIHWLDESAAENFDDSALVDADRAAAVHPAHPAYIIHTSGSTGIPKPVTVTHAAVYALAQQVVSRYDVTASSRVLHGYSTNFDAAVLELVLAFGADATMVIAPTEILDGDEMARFLTAHSVTHYLSTPAVLATVPPVTGVTTVAVGGDVLGSAVVGAWAPGRRMLNAYGPSEATVVATLTDPLDAGDRVTIGTPLPHVYALVLDTRLQQVPVGGVGELYLGGISIARGYRAHAALTAERFVAGPGGRRLYRTGDLVRRQESGVLEYRGRGDSQVQLRGVRVELGDVESALTAHPSVQSAVADVRDGRIVAWVVGADQRELTPWLLERLPLSMVPTVIVAVDRIPVTTNGKVDLSALVAPAPVTGDLSTARTLAEEVILGIFADALDVVDPSADANFFVLGGDSLSATRATSRIGAALGTHVPVRTLFEAPSARALAAAIDMLSEAYVSPPALVHRAQAHDHGALSPAERRVWLQNRFDPTSAAYNIAFALPLPADTDLAVLRAAIVDVLDRHLPLRTVYPSTPDGPVAMLLDAEIVVSSIDDRHADAKLLAETGFDLTVEPPVRLNVVHDVVCRGGEVSLVVVAHHIAVDGLSLAPLTRDVSIALTARRAGAQPEFAALTVDYADYRLWQQDVLDSVAAEQLAYWRRTLAGLPDYLELPTGTPNSFENAAPIAFELDAATLADLRGLANRVGATLFVVIHAALAAVLAEASGTADIAIGTPVSGRSEPALDDLVGMFVGTIVLRTEVAPNKTFEQFVTDVRDRDLDAFAHSAVPFDWVVEAVEPARAIDSHPLFQVLLAVGALEIPTFELGTGEVSPQRIDISENQFDLEVVIEHTAEGLSGQLGYSGERFERSVCVALAERLESVLRLVAARPDIELGSLDFLAARSNVFSHNDGAEDRYTLGTLVRRAAETWPDATAVVDGGESLTYTELDRRSNMLMDSIIAEGAGPGTLVAVALPRSADLVAALWAVAKSGAGYLPIDPNHPAARIEEILEHAQPVTGITRASLAPDGGRWVTVDNLSEPATLRSNVENTAYLDDTAYVIYTSGSTGAPKGVRVTHRGIADLVQSQRETFGVETESRVLQFASPGFDASIFEMLLAFGVGAAVVVVPAEVYAGRELEKFITSTAVTHVCLTPTVLQITDPAATPTVDVVIMAGEAANTELVQRWSHSSTVFNAYGPTEATVMGTCTPALKHLAAVTIGGPVRGFDAVVLDARLRPVPDNVVGELYLGGPGLAEGYLSQPGLTASRFLPNMLGNKGTRLYRTGDLVRWVEHRNLRELEYLGRVDSQVKIRGHRVELAEVEAALLRHPDVEQACVVGHDHSLAAYIAGDTDAGSVREFLTRTIPAYMVPGSVTVVDTLPMSISGKVDARALPEPTLATVVHLAPSTPLEWSVRASFAEVLEIDADRIGVDDNFFDLGGHSLSVVRVMDNLGDELGRPVPVSWLLTHPTAASLAAKLDGLGDAGDDVFDVVLPLRVEGEGEPLFCIHPAIGIAWSYLSLLSVTDRPLYGLQVPGIASGEPSPASIDAFAARYVREIRAVQPTGPYHLLGWSLGGVIAHAVATVLQSSGEEVALLALLDPQLSVPTDTTADAVDFGVEDLARQLGVTGSSFEEIVTQLRYTRSELGFLTSDHLRRMYAPVVAAPRWVAAHRPRIYDGDVVYFAARGSHGSHQWEQYVGGHLSVIRIDAEHEDLLGEASAHTIGRAIGTTSVAEGVA